MYSPGRQYTCGVSKSSNFFSIVVRNAADDGLVGQLDASVTFTQNRDSVSLPKSSLSKISRTDNVC